VRTRRVSVVVLSLAVLTLAACGGSGDDSDSSASTTVPDETTAPDAAEKPTVLVLGDSVGQNIADGLEAEGSVDVVNGAGVNCTIAGGTLQGYEGNVIGGGCDTWREDWAAQVAEAQPDVVVLNTGGWEVVNRWFEEPIGIGLPRTILDEDFAASYRGALDEATQILTAGGAELVVLTTPYFDPQSPLPEQGALANIWFEPYGPVDPPAGWVPPADGQPFVAAKAKVDQINALKQAWASSGGGTVADLQALASPNGEFTLEVDGQVIREDDRVHFNDAGRLLIGEWLAPQLLTLV
jgi:hypothetical protein